MVQSRKKKSVSSKKAPKSLPGDGGSSDAIERQAPLQEASVGGQVFDRVFGEVEDCAMVMLDPDGTIFAWNKGAEKIKGYSATEMIGKNCRIFYTEEDKENNLDAKLLAEARKNGQTNSEGWRVRKDGTRFWASVTITALHNEEGNVRGYLKVIRDLTERKITEDKHSNFVEELKLKNTVLKEREDRYHKMIAEVVDYAIILLGKNGKVLDWNKGAERLKGYSASEIIGKNFRLFYPKEEKDSRLPERFLTEAVREGSLTREGWRIRKNGKRFWGSVTITALHNDEGGVIGFSEVTRDLTQKKIAEDKVSNLLEELRQTNEQLKLSEEKYHGMIAEVQDYAIILLNKHGEIQNWNAGAEVIKGYRAAEVIGKNFRIFYPKEDQDKKLPESLLRYAIRHGKATHEGWRVRKDASRFWGSIVITALHNPRGEIIGFSKVTRDLTEKKKVEDQLKANAAQLDLKNKTLERLNEELSSFSHVASHDLKEPLRKIQSFVSRIEDEGLDPEKSRGYLGKIKSSAGRMQKLIDDLLSYSLVSGGNNVFENVDLQVTLASVTSDLEVAISEKQAIIKAGRLPVVRGISHQLHQLFLNLLSNSIKFSKAGVAPHITIRAEIISGPDIPGAPLAGNIRYHHISVADNGIGFDRKYGDKIFEAFQRLHPSREFAGTGIGLAIAKRIIDNHHGIIFAEGAAGKGATFHLYLPLE